MAFRFLDLPEEVQNLILEKHYEDAEMVMTGVDGYHPEMTEAPLFLKRLPSLNIESTCRKINQEARKVRNNTWPRILTITPSECPPNDFFALMTRPTYQWIRNRTEVLVVHTRGRIGFRAWSMFVAAFPNLRHFKFTSELVTEYQSKERAERDLARAHNGSIDQVALQIIPQWYLYPLAVTMCMLRGSAFTLNMTATAVHRYAPTAEWFRRVIQYEYVAHAGANNSFSINGRVVSTEMMAKDLSKEVEEIWDAESYQAALQYIAERPADLHINPGVQ